MQLTINYNPVPAPRMTQRDKWKKRPVVMKYWNWRDKIKEAYLNLPLEQRIRFTKPVVISFQFCIVGRPKIDLDNLIKGTKDGLVRAGIIQDDSVQQVPRYSEAITTSRCDYWCSERGNKKTCGAVKNCQKGFAVITIDEL